MLQRDDVPLQHVHDSPEERALAERADRGPVALGISTIEVLDATHLARLAVLHDDGLHIGLVGDGLLELLGGVPVELELDDRLVR